MASIDRSIVRSIGILRRVGMHQDVRTYIQRRQKDVSNPHISFIRKLTTLRLAILPFIIFILSSLAPLFLRTITSNLASHVAAFVRALSDISLPREKVCPYLRTSSVQRKTEEGHMICVEQWTVLLD